LDWYPLFCLCGLCVFAVRFFFAFSFVPFAAINDFVPTVGIASEVTRHELPIT
jgi:hypothetical protein